MQRRGEKSEKAFLHTITDEKVIVALHGELCELMVAVNPKLYRKYVMYTKKAYQCYTSSYVKPCTA